MQERELAEVAARMGSGDRVFRLDQQQSREDGVRCPNNPDHGRMGVRADGVLVCGAKVNKMPCPAAVQGTITEPPPRQILTEYTGSER